MQIELAREEAIYVRNRGCVGGAVPVYERIDWGELPWGELYMRESSLRGKSYIGENGACLGRAIYERIELVWEELQRLISQRDSLACEGWPGC